MFTSAFLEGRPDFAAPIPQPQAVRESGYYATRYVIRYEADRRAFRVSLEGFHWREADPQAGHCRVTLLQHGASALPQ
jgi:hypothetical protein